MPDPRRLPCGGRSLKVRIRCSTAFTRSTAPTPWTRCAPPQQRFRHPDSIWFGPTPLATLAGGPQHSFRFARMASTRRLSLTAVHHRLTSSVSILSAPTRSRKTRLAATSSRPTISHLRPCPFRVTTTCPTAVNSWIAIWLIHRQSGIHRTAKRCSSIPLPATDDVPWRRCWVPCAK
ncbi:hypothetical protein D3C77_496470 [compost metagenome]